MHCGCSGDRGAVSEPGPAPWFARCVEPWARWWFRTRVVGRERIPEGPVMLAAVHSALGIADVVVLSWVSASEGLGRRFVGAGHRLVIGRWRPVTALYSAVGVVRGDRATVGALLRAGTTVVVLPGGGDDLTRTVWRWSTPDWGGHTGFVRVAAAAGVPIVPLAVHGAGWTYWLLGVVPFPRSLRRWLGEPVAGVAVTPTLMAAIAAAVLAAAGALSWGWVAMVWLAVVLPLPVRITVGALEPVDPTSGEPEEVAERVRAAVEAALRRGAPGPGQGP